MDIYSPLKPGFVGFVGFVGDLLFYFFLHVLVYVAEVEVHNMLFFCWQG